MPGGVGPRAAVVVGREREFDLLARAVRTARAGESACVFLTGEGGVGKTRLLSEAVGDAHRLGLAVAAGRAPIASPLPFSVVAEALRSWRRAQPAPMEPSPFDAGLRLVLPEWPGSAADTDFDNAQLRLLALEGVVDLVRKIATPAGALVVLDDLHAADPDSLEAARYLATAAPAGVALIGALRPGESARADELVQGLRTSALAETVIVEPLDHRAASLLVASLLDSEPPSELVADIMGRTDGVPLLVEEVLDAFVRAGSVEVDALGTRFRAGAVTVPRTVREMVEVRLERIEPVERDALLAAAVIGDFDPHLLQAVIGGPTVVERALDAGMRVGLLETGAGTIAFRHAIIRDAVIDGAVPYAVHVWHRRVADALGDDGGAGAPDAQRWERRAHHLAAVGDDEEAACLLARAAVLRVEEHALLGAERLARQAADLAQTPATRAAAADALASALSAQGRWADALELDRETVAVHGESPARRYRMSIAALEVGQPEQAAAVIERALAAGDASPWLFVAAGRAALVVGDAETALARASAVLDDTAADVDARLAAVELQGRAYDFLGRREDAIAAWSRQRDDARRSGRTQAQLRAAVLLGKLEIFAGQEPRQLHEAVELARAAGAFVERAWAEENLAIGLTITGHPDAARAVLAEAVPRARELHLDQLAYLVMAQGAVESYRTTDVEHFFREAEAIAPTPDLQLHLAGLRGDIALRAGRYDDAVHWLRRSTELLQAMPGVVPMDSPCWLVWALAAAGDRNEAARVLEDVWAIPDLARWHGRPVVAAAAGALLAGDAAGIDAAIDGAPGLMPLDVALMQVLAAELLDGPARVRWLRAALDTYEEIGVETMVDRVRRALRAAGGKVPRRRRAPAAIPESLAARGVTAREAEVLSLVVEGCSNSEIAARLFLSVRTVESHVSSLLTKLDVRTRAQLTAREAALVREP